MSSSPFVLNLAASLQTLLYISLSALSALCTSFSVVSTIYEDMGIGSRITMPSFMLS